MSSVLKQLPRNKQTFIVRSTPTGTQWSLAAYVDAVTYVDLRMSANLDANAIASLYEYDVLVLKNISVHCKLSCPTQDAIGNVDIGTYPVYTYSAAPPLKNLGGFVINPVSGDEVRKMKSNPSYMNHSPAFRTGQGFDRSIKPMQTTFIHCGHVDYINSVQNDCDSVYPVFEKLKPFRPRAYADGQNRYDRAYRVANYSSDYGPGPCIDFFSNIALSPLLITLGADFAIPLITVEWNVSYEFVGYNHQPTLVNGVLDKEFLEAHLTPRQPQKWFNIPRTRVREIDQAPLQVVQPMSGQPTVTGGLTALASAASRVKQARTRSRTIGDLDLSEDDEKH